MARPTTSAKLVKGAMTKARRNKRLEIEESLKGGKFNGTVLLNDVSAFVWEKLQNPVSRDDLLRIPNCSPLPEK